MRKNALIDSTMLGFEDHGIFTFSLGLDYGGTHQGAGLLCLSGGDPTTYMESGIELLAATLKVVGVEQWEKLKGRSVVALFDTDEWSAPVRGLENFLGTSRVVWADFAGGDESHVD